MNEPRSLSDLLTDLKNSIRSDTIRLKEILTGFHERGFGFLLFIFALPAAIPLPGFGINFIIAAPLLFLTGQQMMGRRTIWLPQSWQAKTLSKEKFNKIYKAAMPWVKSMEFFIHPRLGFITHGLFSNIIGLAGILMALSVCVPLPGTNTVPSFGIALMAAGVLMRDGLAVLAGMIIGLTWVALLIFFGVEIVDFTKDMIKSIL